MRSDHSRCDAHDTAATQPRRVALLAWIAPGLLIVVATVQLALALTSELTPWKGGGFGMFATVDEPGNRVLEVRVRLDEHTRRVVLDDLDAVDASAASYDLEAARSLPNEMLLARAANALETLAWSEKDGELEPAPEGQGHTGEVVELSVVRPDVDGAVVQRDTIATWEDQ